MYAGQLGVPQLLRLCKKYGIKTTWFIPGIINVHFVGFTFSYLSGLAHRPLPLETFPEEMKVVRDAGHELYDNRVPACVAVYMGIHTKSIEYIRLPNPIHVTESCLNDYPTTKGYP